MCQNLSVVNDYMWVAGRLGEDMTWRLTSGDELPQLTVEEFQDHDCLNQSQPELCLRLSPHWVGLQAFDCNTTGCETRMLRERTSGTYSV